jgi:hypothetical protein
MCGKIRIFHAVVILPDVARVMTAVHPEVGTDSFFTIKLDNRFEFSFHDPGLCIEF